MGAHIDLSRMLGRFILGVLAVLVVWKGVSFFEGQGALDTISVILASAAAFAFSGALNGGAERGDTTRHAWIAPVARIWDAIIAVLRTSPIARYATGNAVGRLLVAAGFGVGVAVIDFWAAQAPVISAIADPFWHRTWSLATSSAVAWSIVGWLTGDRPTLVGRVLRAALDAAGFEIEEGSRLGSAITSAVARTVITVALRAAFAGVVPLVLSNVDLQLFLGGIVLLLVAAGGATVEFARKVDGLVATSPAPASEAVERTAER